MLIRRLEQSIRLPTLSKLKFSENGVLGNMARSGQPDTTVGLNSAEIALPKGIWCGAPILGPSRRLHINNVPGRMKTKKTLANYR
jgi:hypothetical protein